MVVRVESLKRRKPLRALKLEPLTVVLLRVPDGLGHILLQLRVQSHLHLHLHRFDLKERILDRLHHFPRTLHLQVLLSIMSDLSAESRTLRLVVMARDDLSTEKYKYVCLSNDSKR